ncbi:endonuclease/exonuclease/phosphatase [Photobacterium frigidiphilum]|uniref:Endonuclease/exonuclease/phosphatase n=1 Tax=Photobacterium frigidiphilum TaxID=264736 RepID=A0A2T3JIJ7_9GAMM|nr:ExeM/NucH family extracellular endonuclease [Photobacterium frigidiphilum]PSU48805.1 endonuclease/exonuclease/phosphatase [Photobacterium frigidiphilum]
MKKSILALSIGAAVSFGAQADILITEYAEPNGGNNKLIEIGNTGSIEVFLDGYTLRKDSNGANTFDNEVSLDGLVIQPNSVVIVAHSSHADLPFTPAKTSASLNFNGNDAVGLFDTTDTMIDVVGTVDDSKFGENVVLRRSVLTPSAVYDATQWTKLHEGTGKDYSDFGSIGEGGGEPVEPTPPSNIVSSTVQDIQGPGWSSTIDGIDVPGEVYESTNYHEVTGVVTAIQKTALGSDLKVGFFMQAPSDGNALTSDGIFVETNKITDITVGSEVTVVAKVKEDWGWTKLVNAYSVTKTDSADSVLTATPLRVLESDEDFDFTLERHEGMLVKFDKESDMRISRTFGFDFGPKRNNMVVSNGQVNLHPNQNNAPAVHDYDLREGILPDTDAERQTDCNQDKRIVVESFEAVTKGTHIPWYPEFGSDSAVPIPDGTTTTEDYVRIGDVLDGFEGVVSYSWDEYRFYVTNTVTKDNFAREDSERTQAPVLKEGGDLRVATFNVLNYFNSPFGGDSNPTDSNRGAKTDAEFQLQGDKIARAIIAVNADIVGLMEIENNGFGEDSAVAHLVAKINNLIDDETEHYSYVVGNEGDKYVGSDAIANQVIFKASKVSLDTYRLIKMPEQHAPEVAYIDTKDKNQTESGNNYQRDTLTPTFKINGTEEKITVAVNHLKSKGSTCWEDVQTGKQLDSDKQGSCENFRVSAAFHLGQELSKIDGYKLILGDLNSYGNEDPIMVLTNRDKAPKDHVIKAARNTSIGGEDGTPLHGDDGAVIADTYGYVNAVRQLHPDSYSYSYNDEVGTLDYILVTPELMNKVVDATDWNINAGESTLFQYADYNNCLDGECSTRFSDLYRASDHDPAVIDLKLGSSVNPEPPIVIPTPTAPKNPPADLPEVPEAPVAGEPIQVMFDLTNIDGTPLHAGDKAVLNIAKINRSKAAFAGADTNSVTLTQEIIKQGWVELEGDVSDAGEFQMTKQIIDGRTGQLVYTSPAETIKVAEKGDDKTKPVDPNPGHGHGGSTGLFGLLSLLGLGFFRRKMSK